MPYPDYRVFVSSPGDMLPERTLAADTVERVNASLHGISLTAYLSDNSLYLAHQGPQAGIPQTCEFDLVICLFWKRMGTQLLPKAFDAADGRKRTGTEYEFETAVEAAQHSQGESGAPVPAVLVYRKTEAVRFNAEHVDQELAQYRALQVFFERWIRDVQGHHLGYANEFETSQQFTQMFERHLRDWLALQRRAASWNIATDGSPFRGLEVFEHQHAAVYFGRDRCILEARARLKRGAANGWPALWIVGASGSGKSSLLRAGLLPSLERSEGYLRSVVLKPSELGDDLLHGVAARLLDALPELGEGSFRDAAALATVCAESPASTVIALDSALAAWATAEASKRTLDLPPQTRIVVAIDQAEELLTTRTATEREQFVKLFRALLGNDRVWLVLSFRSDFYATLQHDKLLLPLKTNAEQMDLSAPSPAELALMITEPARAAGLTLELRDDGLSLTDEISRDTTGVDSLPILEFALKTLFEKARARGESTLLIKDYLDIGRAAGALSTAAEQTLATLPQLVQEAFPRVLREIADINLQADSRAPTAKACAMDTFANDPNATQLVEALSQPETRLLSLSDIDGKPHLRVSHESLFTQWPRAREQIQRDARRLDARRRLQENAEMWRDADGGERSQRLLGGFALEEALDLRSHWKLTGTLSNYIDQSHAASRRRERLQRVAFVVFGIVAVVAAVAALYAYRQQVRAEGILEEAAHRALGRMQEAIKSNDMATAHAHLAESLRYLPTPRSILAANYQIQHTSPEMYKTLSEKMSTKRLSTMLIDSAEFSPDGRKILTTSGLGSDIWDAHSRQHLSSAKRPIRPRLNEQFTSDGLRVIAKSEIDIHMWDVADGSAVENPFAYDQKFDIGDRSRVQVSRDGKRAITYSDSVVRIYDILSSTLLGTIAEKDRVLSAALLSNKGDVIATVTEKGPIRVVSTSTLLTFEESPLLRDHVACLVFSPNDSIIVAGLAGQTLAIWNRSSNTIVETSKTNSNCANLAFSPDGANFITIGQKIVSVWRSTDGLPIKEISHNDSSILSARFSPDGMRLLTVGSDRSVRIWLLETGKQLGATLRHPFKISTATFDIEGVTVMTTSEGIVRLWDVRSGSAIETTLHHAGALNAVNFSATGALVVTATTGGTVQVWQADNGQPIGHPFAHDQAVNDACFSPDDEYVLTASKDGAARLWNRQQGTLEKLFVAQDGELGRAIFSPDGTRIVTTSKSGTTKIWNSKTQQPVGRPVVHQALTGPVFSPDGRTLLTIGSDDSVRLWDGHSGEPKGPPLEHENKENVVEAKFSYDGQRILTASRQRVRLWSSTGRKTRDMNEKFGLLMSANFSPSHDRIVTTSFFGTISVRDISTGKTLFEHDLPSREWGFATFSPNGTLLLASSKFNLYLWDANTLTPLGLPISTEGFDLPKFSADGRYMLSASIDGIVKIWEPSSELDATIEAMIESLHALGGLRIDQSGRVSFVPEAEFTDWKNSVTRAENRSNFDKIMRWHLADRSTRTISVSSLTSVSQFIRNQIDWAIGSQPSKKSSQRIQQILHDTYQIDPSHPLIPLALIHAGLASGHDELLKSISLRRLAASSDVDLVTRGAEILRLVGDADATEKAAKIALALDRNFDRALAVKAWAEETKKTGSATPLPASIGKP